MASLLKDEYLARKIPKKKAYFLGGEEGKAKKTPT